MYQNCIFVIGMHRSGTSATAGVLTYMGYPTAKIVLSPNQTDNPKGYFEDLRIVELNDKILTSINSNWHDTNLDVDRVKRFEKEIGLYRNQLVEIIQENYSQYKEFVIKDPRICHLFPLYKMVMKKLNINCRAVVTYRDPLDVAKSLQKRDNFSIGKGIALWFNYFFAAELNTRNIQRVFLNYDKLLEKLPESIGMMSHYLELEGLTEIFNERKDEINVFLDSKLRHSISKKGDELGYYDYYKEIKDNKNNLNEITIDEFSKINERYCNTKKLFYFPEVKKIMEGYDSEKEKLVESLFEKNRLLFDKEKKIQEKNKIIELMQATISWKLTKPLRELNSVRKKMNLFVKNNCN